ncbi:RHS repeat-associated core domain-containing protein, partial [Bacillus sp. DJP31]|uniref:RHS repeat-associated core domain-containing protein n=1 Tax=Bacillus sp. DJP31 TaxID=3409789 RepID=UPI003BB6EBEF
PTKVQRLKYYRDASGNPISFSLDEVVYYYQFNARGDVIAITDAAGNIKATYDYDEWGNVVNITGDKALAEANIYRYVGKYGVMYDKDTNLYFMGWRDYDPTTGRFITPDEYEGTEEDPTSLNRYLYADADPVNNIDPDGHAPKWLQKGWKATKKYSKSAYNLAIGDDINTLRNPKAKWYQKAGATLSIASNFVPGAGQAKWAVKGAVAGVKYGKKAKKVQKFTASSLKSEKKAQSTPKKAVISKPKGAGNATGYHATKPEYVQSIFDNGLKPSRSGRIGSGVYVADTPQGAIAEFKHYYPDLEPAIVKVQYAPGKNADLRPHQNDVFTPTYGQGNRIANRTSYDSITFQSQRGGTANTVIRNGSAIPIK